MTENDGFSPQRTSIQSRASKIEVADFGKLPAMPSTIGPFIRQLPDILAARDLKLLIADMIRAKRLEKGIMIGLGGHVIKTGVTPYLIELMKNGYITAIALNGAAMIHDFEMALSGHTSEDVEQELVQGRFGFTEETGTVLNKFIVEAADRGQGMGEYMAKAFAAAEYAHADISIIAQAGKLNIPVTVHVAIGTDVIQMHPECDGAATGQTSFRDFQRFCQHLERLDGGGGYLNCGSAVILPEVFLKALSRSRNTGHEFRDFFTANFDFIRHYRPTQSIINRPRLFGSRTYALTGHHEIMLPLLTAAVIEAGTCLSET